MTDLVLGGARTTGRLWVGAGSRNGTPPFRPERRVRHAGGGEWNVE
ncbi:hypothetical protein [Nonomuraea dietziae]